MACMIGGYRKDTVIRGTAARVRLGLALWAGLVMSTALADTVVLEFERPQTAVLDPAHWDQSFAGELYFDALRALLVRFPEAAEAVHRRLHDGYEIEKAELVLRWVRQEGPNPERGRSGWGADGQYARNPGQWHVQARLLRRPWSVDDAELAPTFNAYIPGAGYWERGGGRGDGPDRFAQLFGPEPLHQKPPEPVQRPTTPAALGEDDDLLGDPLEMLAGPEIPEARLDVTATLTDERFGKTVSDRLRRLSDCGLQVHKSEIRDMRYRSFWAYDWAVSIGYMRIWIEPPRLVVTLRKADLAVEKEELPPATDVHALAEALHRDGTGGHPSVKYPDGLAERIAAHLRKPDDVPNWQWQRISELMALGQNPRDTTLALGRGFNWSAILQDDRESYMSAMHQLLRMPPRTWHGHLSSDFALLPTIYGDLLPDGVMDHLKLYWKAWLHPAKKSAADLGGGRQRGGPSYFRGYSHGGGTMNFGHNAVMGALLGAQLIDAEYPLADARRGLRNLLLGGFGLRTGAHQEIGDTYYQALTLASPAAIAHFAAAPEDRLVARIHLDRLLEMLISMYHPGIRRLTHPMGRGSYYLDFLYQEGPYHVMHTLSRKGALIHLDDLDEVRDGTPVTWGQVHGLSILGDEGPPQRMGILSPWITPCMADPVAAVVDEKTYPWAVHARDFSPGCRPGGWHVNYLSEHFALASRDNANENYGVTSVVAQWRRAPRQVDHLDDSGHLVLDFGSNDKFTQAGTSMGEFGIVQHGPKLLAMKGLPSAERIRENAGTERIRALHASVLIAAFGDTSEREVWINDTLVEAVSGARVPPDDNWQERVESAGARVEAAEGDVITIKDGVTYLALIPITANALQRRREVEIAFEHPVLLVHNYIFDVDLPDQGVDRPAAPGISALLGEGTGVGDPEEALGILAGDDDAEPAPTPLNPEDLHRLEHAPTAGFVIEMGDASDYGSFEAFRLHMNTVRLERAWNAADRHLELRYRSGDDVLDMAYNPRVYPAVSRAVNGQWPYLPNGIMRESPWAIHGTRAELVKNEARLVTAEGAHAYLLASPVSEFYVGYNPTLQKQPWRLVLPDDREIAATDDVGLLRVTVRPDVNSVWVDHVAADGETAELVLSGFPELPHIELNGKRAELQKRAVDGRELLYLGLQP